MAEKKIDVVLEDYGTKPVPAEKTRNWFEMGIVIWGVAVCIPAFMIGGLIGGASPLGAAIVIIMIGALILTVLSLATGNVGARTRLSIGMSAKFTFGQYGNILMAILLFIGAFGWFGVQLEVFGQAIGAAIALPRWLIIIVGGALMTLTAMYGFRAIERLTLFVIPILLVLLVVTLVKAYAGITLAEVFAKAPAQAMPFGILVSIVAGGYAVGAVIQPDITRYSKGHGHASVAMVFGMFIGFPLVLIMAAFLVAASGESQFATVMLAYNIGAWRVFAIVVIVFATWTTNDNNLYSAALSSNAIFPKMKKWQLTVIGGALGTLLALFGILGQLTNWIMILGVTVPPIGAVMAIDFLLFKSEVYTYDKIESLPAMRIVAYLSWAAGTLVGFLTFFKVFTFTTAPALDSIIVAAVVHFVLMLIAGNKVAVPKKA